MYSRAIRTRPKRTDWLPGHCTPLSSGRHRHSHRRPPPPLLHALGPRRIRKARTVAAGLPSRAWIQDVRGHLSPEALVQYVLLWARLQQVTLSDESDVLTWRWTTNDVYSAKSCYKALFAGSTIEPSWRLTWKSWAPLRIKVFLWLAFHGRC